VIGNLPFNVAAQSARLCDKLRMISKWSWMFQAEVAARIRAYVATTLTARSACSPR